jgi:hypothetical protein
METIIISSTLPETIFRGHLYGEPVVYVPLRGKHGQGLMMTVDTATFDRLGAEQASRCYIIRNVYGHRFVALPEIPPRLLSHWIVGATKGCRVQFLNGNFLDLRVSNLQNITAANRARRSAQMDRGRLRRLRARIRQVIGKQSELAGLQTTADGRAILDSWSKERREGVISEMARVLARMERSAIKEDEHLLAEVRILMAGMPPTRRGRPPKSATPQQPPQA